MSGTNPDPKAKSLPFPKEAEVPKSPAPLPVCWTNYIGGDFAGLHELSLKLYRVAAEASPKMRHLVARVNEVAGKDSDRWSGVSARSFMATFGQDSSLMSGLSEALAAIADVIDTLARRLAELEREVEQMLEQGFQAGYFVQDANFYKRHYPSPPPTAAGQELLTKYADESIKFSNALIEIRQKADEARSQAARRLVALEAVLSKGLSYYRGTSGISGALDPNGLLNRGQQSWYNPRIDALQKALQQQQKDQESAGYDLKKAAGDLKTVGGAAQTIGGIVELIPGGQSVGGSISKIGDVLDTISGVADIAAGAGGS